MQNNPNNMNQPFQQGNLNHAVGGNQAYNPGRQILQQQPNMHPATRPPMMPMAQVPMHNMMPPQNMFAQRTPPPLPQGNPVPPTPETNNNIQNPIAMEKINNFSQYLRGLRNPPQLQNYPDINVFGTYF